MPNSGSESEFIISIFLGLGGLFGLEGTSAGSFAANYIKKYYITMSTTDSPYKYAEPLQRNALFLPYAFFCTFKGSRMTCDFLHVWVQIPFVFIAVPATHKLTCIVQQGGKD